MKALIVIALILIPVVSGAQTDCRAVELQDHLEAVCTGDEKAVPAPETAAALPDRHTGALRMNAAEPSPQAAVTTESAASPQMQSTPGLSNSVPVQQQQNRTVHRQGRQQYRQGMDEAKAARLQLIEELQHSLPAP